MTDYTQNDKTLALAGIYQAAQMVYELATTGKTDEQAFKASLHSLFVENPSSTLEVYGDSVNDIQLGIHTLTAQMKSDQAKQTRNIEITRYVLSLMILQKKLKQTDGLQKISNVLETAKAQQEHFGDLHENVIATVARAYSENVSTLHPRIMVNGHHGHLNNQRIANKIRALLLAGLRSAVLWYQVGGSRWGLIWSRKKYLQSAQAFYRPNYNYLQNRLQEDQTKQENQSNVGGWYKGEGETSQPENTKETENKPDSESENSSYQSIFKDADKTAEVDKKPETSKSPTNDSNVIPLESGSTKDKNKDKDEKNDH